MWLWLGLTSATELRLDCIKGKYVTDRAYQNDWSFDSLYLEDCFEVIGTSAFENTSITAVRLPGTLREILGYGFQSCKKLTSVVIPEGTTTLDGACFASCSSLTTFEIPSTVSYIGPSVFTFVHPDIEMVISSGNKIYEWRDGLLIHKKSKILVFAPDRYTSIVVPSDVTTLGQACFERMLKIQSIEAVSIKTLKAYIFRGDSNLVNVTFGSSLGAWDTTIFEGCGRMANLFIEEHETYSSINGILYQKSGSSLSIIYLPAKKATTVFEVPKEVLTIDASPFKGTNVAEFALEEGHPTLECYKGVIYSSDFKTLLACPPKMSESAFEWHPNVTVIGGKSFYGHLSMSSISFPYGVTTIGYYAFSTAFSFKAVTLPESVTTFERWCFHGVYATSLVIPSKVTVVKDGMCAWMIELATVEIKGRVTVIEASAFSDCHLLRTINLPACLELIGNNAFHRCYVLTSESANFSEGLETIGARAFYGCTGLVGNLTIPSSMATVYERAFFMCSNLECVTIINCNTDIREKAFYSSEDAVIQTICIMTKYFTMPVVEPRVRYSQDVLRLAGGILSAWLY